MTKILFINTNCSWNKGSAAQVISASEILKKNIPDATFAIVSYCPDMDEIHSRKYNLNVVGYFGEDRSNHRNVTLLFSYHLFVALFRCTLHFISQKVNLKESFLLNEKFLKAYANADIIVDLSGDSFGDSRGGIALINIIGMLIGYLLNKPIVFYSQSIGPFKKLSLPFAKYVLNKADLIIVREKITEKYIEEIGVVAPIYLAADCAFILPSENGEDIASELNINLNKKPRVGISANALLDDKAGAYVKLMAQLIDYLIEKFDCLIILVPHVVSAAENGRWDDRRTGEKIYQLLKNKDNIVFIRNDYSPEKLKGIIRLCDMFIGGRMHADIAALSSCIPTIATAWSHKYYGIMQILGQEKYVCDIRTMDFDELRSKVDALWSNKDLIHEELKSKMESQKESAMLSGKLVSDLLHSLKLN